MVYTPNAQWLIAKQKKGGENIYFRTSQVSSASHWLQDLKWQPIHLQENSKSPYTTSRGWGGWDQHVWEGGNWQGRLGWGPFKVPKLAFFASNSLNVVTWICFVTPFYRVLSKMWIYLPNYLEWKGTSFHRNNYSFSDC